MGIASGTKRPGPLLIHAQPVTYSTAGITAGNRYLPLPRYGCTTSERVTIITIDIGERGSFGSPSRYSIGASRFVSRFLPLVFLFAPSASWPFPSLYCAVLFVTRPTLILSFYSFASNHSFILSLLSVGFNFLFVSLSFPSFFETTLDEHNYTTLTTTTTTRTATAKTSISASYLCYRR